MESHSVKVGGLHKAQGRALPACLPPSASPCDNPWPPLTCNVQEAHDPLWAGGAKEDVIVPEQLCPVLQLWTSHSSLLSLGC